MIITINPVTIFVLPILGGETSLPYLPTRRTFAYLKYSIFTKTHPLLFSVVRTLYELLLRLANSH